MRHAYQEVAVAKREDECRDLSADKRDSEPEEIASGAPGKPQADAPEQISREERAQEDISHECAEQHSLCAESQKDHENDVQDHLQDEFRQADGNVEHRLVAHPQIGEGNEEPALEW